MMKKSNLVQLGAQHFTFTLNAPILHYSTPNPSGFGVPPNFLHLAEQHSLSLGAHLSLPTSTFGHSQAVPAWFGTFPVGHTSQSLVSLFFTKVASHEHLVLVGSFESI